LTHYRLSLGWAIRFQNNKLYTSAKVERAGEKRIAFRLSLGLHPKNLGFRVGLVFYCKPL
jgi:hypothetical protein